MARSRCRRMFGVLVVASASAAAVGMFGASPAEADTAAGRVTLNTPVRMIDMTIAAGVDVPIGGGLLVVSVVGPTAEGTADVFPCGSGPTGDPTFHFLARETVIRTAVGVDSTCVRSTTALRLVVDRHGFVGPTAQPGGLQYLGLPQWEDVFVGGGAADGSSAVAQVGRGATFATDTAAGLYEIGATSDGAATVAVHGCDHAQSNAIDLSVNGRFSEAVTVVGLDSGELLWFATTGKVNFAVRLVGTLSASGSARLRSRRC